VTNKNALALYQDQPAAMDLMKLGNVLSESGYFSDTKGAAQAIVRVLAGQELGIGPIAAMTGIHIVQGRVAIGANLMAAAVKRSGRYNYRVTEMSDKVCSIVFYEGKDEIGVSTFTVEDARKAQTKNLDKFPRNMLFARAMSNGVRWYCPDVFSAAVYTPDELGGRVDDDDKEYGHKYQEDVRPVERPADFGLTVEGDVIDEPAASYNPPADEDEPSLALTRVREQIKALAKLTGDALPELVAQNYTELNVRQLDALSTELDSLTEAVKARTLTPLAVATELRFRSKAVKAVAARLAEAMRPQEEAAEAPKAA
jgi:hypothetical protein